MADIALFWLISRPNSRASLAAALGMEPAREVVMIVFDLLYEFSDRRTIALDEAVFLLVAKVLEP